MGAEVSNFFSFTSYLTGLAFLIMAWVNVDYKYRLRLYLSWLSRTRLFVAVAVLGILVLISDFVIAQNYPIPCTPCVQHFWQLMLASCFLIIMLWWLCSSFIFPPRFNRRNCRKFENELVIALEYGRDDVIEGVIDFLARSIKDIVENAPVTIDKGKKLSDIQESALNVLHLMDNDYFCKVVVKYHPGVVVELFREIIRQRKHHLGLNTFAGNFITQALQEENSFVYRETKMLNGALSWDKPYLSNIYSNIGLIYDIPDLLEPHYELTASWNHKQVRAYSEVLLVTFGAVLKEGCPNPIQFQRYFEILQWSARRIYRVNGMGDEYYYDENHLVYESVIRFYDQLVQTIAVTDKIADIHPRYEPQNSAKDIIDVVAASIVDLMYATSSLKTPQETSRSVREIGFCLQVLESKTESANYELLIKKVCRSLYKTFNDNCGIKGISVLVFCLDSYGLVRIDYSSKYIRLINRFVIFYARHHLLEMYGEAKKLKTLKLPDGITIDEERKQIRKVSVEDVYGNTHESVLDLVG